MQGRYKQTVAPTLKPITLDEAKAQCSVSGTTDHDEYLTQLIDRAADAVGTMLDRQVMSATWTLKLDWFPAQIYVAKPPVTAISSITYTDTAGDTQTLSSAYYQTDLSGNDTPARIMPAYGYSWPSTLGDTYNAVTVTFTCGYTVALLPPALKHAISFLVAHWFANREPVVAGSMANLPTGLEMLLSLEDWGAY